LRPTYIKKLETNAYIWQVKFYQHIELLGSV